MQRNRWTVPIGMGGHNAAEYATNVTKSHFRRPFGKPSTLLTLARLFTESELIEIASAEVKKDDTIATRKIVTAALDELERKRNA